MSSTHSAPFRKTLCLAICMLAGIAILAGVAAPAQAFRTVYASGQYGYWKGSEGTNICNAGGITTLRPYVSGTPSYPYSYQKIFMIPRLDYSPDGTTWSTKKWGWWQQRTVYGSNQIARFDTEGIGIPSGKGYWRVAMEFQWSVGGVLVGRVVNVFNAGPAGWGEYSAAAGAAVANNSSAYFCLMYY